MRIHIQNAPNDPDFAVTEAMFPPGHTLSFADDEAGFIAGVAEAEALITTSNALRLYCRLLGPKLKLIFCTSAGLEKLAPYDWLPNGVMLLNNSGVHGPRVAEYAAMALLMLAGKMPQMIAAQHAQRWEKHYASVLAGRHLAVIGTGDLGAASAKAARLFAMRTTGIRKSAEPHPDFDATVTVAHLDAVLPTAEFLLLAAPLTAETEAMLTRARMELLPKGAFVINVGRGALLDQDALCDLLDTGHLGGAVLDVFVPEPIPPGHRLWTTRNLVITPHVAADDPKTYARDSVVLFFENLAAWQAGKPMPNVFDTARGY